MKEILEQSNLRLPSGWRMVLWALVVLGILTFIGGFGVGLAGGPRGAVLIQKPFFGGMGPAGGMVSVDWQDNDCQRGGAL